MSLPIPLNPMINPSCIVPQTGATDKDKLEYIHCRLNAIKYHLTELASYLEKEQHGLAARNTRIAAFDLRAISNSLGIKNPY